MAAMVRAGEVMRETREALAQAEDDIRRHPYTAALAAGRVSTDALRAFPGHQFHMWRSDMRSAAQFVHRFGDGPGAGFFLGFLHGEVAARDGIFALARRLEMTEQDLERYEPTAEGFAYAAYLAWLAAYGSAAEVACGMAVNLAAWGHNCGLVGAALRERYGFAEADTAFLDGFAALPPQDEAALAIIQDDLDRGVAPQRIVRAARLIQSYETMFWDAMARAAGLG